MSKKPSRQEYIVKVRYSNNLPPPPLNPKFLEYSSMDASATKKEAEDLIGSLFRKDNFTPLMENVDNELGMRLNLINNTGFFDESNESVLFSMTDKNNKDRPITLQPKDRALLRDAGIGKISKSEPGVSFLRRTEYISEKQLPKVDASLKSDVASRKEEKLDANAQLKAVEDSFESAQESLNNLSTLKHPRKKHLKAVSTWPLLPDTAMMDTKFLSVKFLGSASVNRELETIKRKQGDQYDEEKQNNALETAILKPITSEDGEWLSLYEDTENAKLVKEKLHSTSREQPATLPEDDQEFKFKHIKNYEMNFLRFSKPNEELAIKFMGENRKRSAAYWYPVTGRIDLKKYRASTNMEVNRFLKESTADVINFKVREPTTSELKKMDSIRSEFDPMEYEGEDDE